MKDPFAGLEDRSKAGAIISTLVVVALIAIFFLLFRWPGASPRSVIGVVESSGAVSVARVAGATREAASVRLNDGTLVIAQVAAGGPLAPGDKVRLLEQPRILGGAAYQVTAKVAAE